MNTSPPLFISDALPSPLGKFVFILPASAQGELPRWNLQTHSDYSGTILAGFHSRRLWGLLFLALGLLVPQGALLQLCYSSWFSLWFTTHGCEPSPIRLSAPPTRLYVASLYPDVLTSTQLDFRRFQFWMMVFCSLVVILGWLWEDASYLHCHLKGSRFLRFLLPVVGKACICKPLHWNSVSTDPAADLTCLHLTM